jgi:hypothetical protein
MKRKYLFTVLFMFVGMIFLSGELAARVTGVKVTVNPTSYKGKCPKTFTFYGVIRSNKAGIVRYQWKRSDGAVAPVKTIRFRRRGTKRVSTTWTIGKTYSGWQAIQILSPNNMWSNRAPFKLVCLGSPVVVKPGVIDSVRPIKPGVITRVCPDPAAVEIRFQIVRSYTQFKKRIRITGIVKNVGGKAFNSGPNQAKAYLYEVPIGASSGRIVAQREIRTLAAGATMQLVYERDWNSSSPSEGEFPPNYRLQILYDPDIYMDANKDNDDCNQNNNKKERSGTEINAMIR